MDTLIVVHIDGLCEPVNPGGTATFGYVIRDDSGSILASKSGIVGKGPTMTNNVAEYTADNLRFQSRPHSLPLT